MNIKFKVRFEDAKLVIGANPSKLSEEVAVWLSTRSVILQQKLKLGMNLLKCVRTRVRCDIFEKRGSWVD
jgi:hypothetical protein